MSGFKPSEFRGGREGDGAQDGSWDNMPGEGGSLVDSHGFTPRRGESWERCAMCGLAAAAHGRSHVAPPAAEVDDEPPLPFGSTHEINLLDLNLLQPSADA